MTDVKSILYSNKLDDLTAAYEHFDRKAKKVDPVIWWGGAIFAFVICSWDDSHRPLVRILAGLLGTAVWLLVYWAVRIPALNELWRDATMRLYGRSVKGVLGEHRLTAMDSGLLEET